MMENDKKGKVAIYIDGGFDLPHSGHYNAIRQAKNMGDYLVAGINSDEDLMKNKGPTIMNVKERQEIMKHCKFVDEVAGNTPYTPTIELLKELNCGFYAHGDDPCINSDGVDITQTFVKRNMFKIFKRTEGVSTTDITGKLLALAEYNLKGEAQEEESPALRITAPPKQQFLATTRRIINFANHNMPKSGDTIVYIQGSFDLLHHGHLKRLEAAKKLGDFLFVGLWDDEMVRFYKGQHYPILSLQERVLMCLACKHVDDIVIGAPFIITKDLLTSLNIKKVVKIVDTAEDTVMKKHEKLDQFAEAREAGILEEVTINDAFYDITTEMLAKRVLDNKAEFQKKFDKKNKS